MPSSVPPLPPARRRAAAWLNSVAVHNPVDNPRVARMAPNYKGRKAQEALELPSVSSLCEGRRVRLMAGGTTEHLDGLLPVPDSEFLYERRDVRAYAARLELESPTDVARR